ncbi:tetratricopeptide repeat protein [Avibacterium avium]|uniref:tetratricopeptide repeat protein n=1 Tax=Avibacterium avium TaxID=751 RepID=UPI003BF7CA2E
MKFTKTLLTTMLFSFSVLGTAQLAYAISAQEKQYQQGLEAANKNDFATAFKLWLPLAEQGNAVAQNSLGVMYEKGQGIKQDYAEAVKWYLQAAEQGNAVAQNNLGLLYDSGKGVKKDYAEAAKWYLQAAEQGYVVAQANLASVGARYEKGIGVRQDLQKAKEYYGLACDSGWQEGCDNYRKLNEAGIR